MSTSNVSYEALAAYGRHSNIDATADTRARQQVLAQLMQGIQPLADYEFS